VDEHHSEWQERQMMALTMQPQQQKWVKAKWKSDMSLNICSVFGKYKLASHVFEEQHKFD